MQLLKLQLANFFNTKDSSIVVTCEEVSQVTIFDLRSRIFSAAKLHLSRASLSAFFQMMQSFVKRIR
jgi:hypothetical protein